MIPHGVSETQPSSNGHRSIKATLAVLACVVLGLTLGCVATTQTSGGFGAQSEHVGYVPARIAILPCSPWPSGARFASLPLTNVKDADVAGVCAALDAFILKSFDGQPYMKGYSPKKIQELLATANQPGLLAQLPQTWVHQIGDCLDCTSTPAFYRATTASRTAWLAWLNTLSGFTRNADAVLLPFVTYASERRYDDRGLAVAERAAGVVLLLVDTNNGGLLWAGGREAAVPAKHLDGGNVHTPLAPPPWSDVQDRLFVEDLWREFPGRQIF